MKFTSVRRILMSSIIVCALVGSVRADQLASNINGTDIGFWGVSMGFWSGVPFSTAVAHASGIPQRGIFMQVYTDAGGKPGYGDAAKLVTDDCIRPQRI
jgi:hypothetical protein